MILTVKVIPKAKRNEVKELSPGNLKIYVSAPAIDGKANKSVIELLVDYCKVKKSAVCVVRGERSPNKMIEVSRE